MMGQLTAARLAELANQEQSALALLDDLLALGEQRRLPRLRIASLCERIRLHALRNRTTLCATAERMLDQLVSELSGHAWGLLEPVVDIQIGIARAYAAIARQDWSLALNWLNATAPIAERLQRGRDMIQIDLLSALAKKRCGEDGTNLLQEALVRAKMLGLARILTDTHPDLVHWACQLHLVDDARASLHTRFDPIQPLDKKIQLVSTAVRWTVSTRSALLSPKEREVLALLINNMSNKQIALAMGISSETIKWHIKNLFKKLNAGTRKHLVDRARMAGLLEDLGSG